MALTLRPHSQHLGCWKKFLVHLRIRPARCEAAGGRTFGATTIRDQLSETTGDVPACAGCHSKIDPLVRTRKLLIPSVRGATKLGACRTTACRWTATGQLSRMAVSLRDIIGLKKVLLSRAINCAVSHGKNALLFHGPAPWSRVRPA